jgi:hypothetical protein
MKAKNEKEKTMMMTSNLCLQAIPKKMAGGVL